GLPGKIEHPEVRKAMDRVLKATVAHNKTAGIHLLHPHRAVELVKEHVDIGYRLITLGSDLVILNETSRNLLAECQKRLK
ncbi:MAG: hypothetical protein EB127_23830, partial [Alphaproteobacteria bacterium]|nr:hypothetical protein [Alphaproteobacteria bacterium]